MVHEHGFDGIFWELRPGAPPPLASDPSDVPATCISFAPDDRNAVEPERAAEIAEMAGARSLRICAESMANRSYVAAYEATVRLCEAYSRAAASRGIRVLLHQRWGTLTASASQLHRVLSQFDPRTIGCIYDAGSMTIEGFEEYRIGLEILSGYVADVHLANTRHFPSAAAPVWEWEWSGMGDGLIDLQRLFRALRRVDYDGWITLADRSRGWPLPMLLELDRRILEQTMADFEGVGSHNPCRTLDDHIARDERSVRLDGMLGRAPR